MTRTDVMFNSEGVNCAAWLYRPDQVEFLRRTLGVTAPAAAATA